MTDFTFKTTNIEKAQAIMKVLMAAVEETVKSAPATEVPGKRKRTMPQETMKLPEPEDKAPPIVELMASDLQEAVKNVQALIKNEKDNTDFKASAKAKITELGYKLMAEIPGKSPKDAGAFLVFLKQQADKYADSKPEETEDEEDF